MFDKENTPELGLGGVPSELMYGSGPQIENGTDIPHQVELRDSLSGETASFVLRAASADSAVGRAFKDLQNCSRGVHGKNISSKGVGLNITAVPLMDLAEQN